MRTKFKNMCRNISNSYYLTTKTYLSNNNTYLQRKDYQDAKMQEHSTCNEEKDETIETDSEMEKMMEVLHMCI